MTKTGLLEIVRAIRNTLTPTEGVLVIQSADQFVEGMNTVPAIQIYPESGDPQSGEGVAQASFRGAIRIHSAVVNVDIYGRQRSHIGEDLEEVLELFDTVYQRLEEQRTKPYFGIPALKAFNWTWERATFIYGDPEIRYVGLRFVLNLTLF